jgi:hypothetical protein
LDRKRYGTGEEQEKVQVVLSFICNQTISKTTGKARQKEVQ